MFPPTPIPALRSGSDIEPGLLADRDRVACNLMARNQQLIRQQTAPLPRAVVNIRTDRRSGLFHPVTRPVRSLLAEERLGAGKMCPAPAPRSINNPSDLPDGGMCVYQTPQALGEIPARIPSSDRLVSTVLAHRLEEQTTLVSTPVLMNEQESGMAAEGGGGVKRVTQLPVVTSRALRDHLYVVTRDGTPTLQAQRELRALANQNVDASDIADAQAALAKHVLGAISFGPNTDRYLENVGLKVTKLHRSRSGIPYHEKVAAGGPEGG